MSWLDEEKDMKLLMTAVKHDIERVDADLDRMDLNSDASFDAGFEAGVLASEAGLGRYVPEEVTVSI